jgi:hypothetical protein
MPFSTLHPAPSRFRSTLPALAAAALLSALTLPGAAIGDILVMRDGTQVVTDGPWTAKGRQIVFNLPNGQLSAVRASEVDIARSEQATREAAAPKPVAPSPQAVAAQQARKKPVLVLTDKDIPQANPEVFAESPAGLALAESLAVVDSGFDALQGDTAFRIVGAVVNNGIGEAQGVRVIATLSGNAASGAKRVYCEAALDRPLPSGERAEFVCDVPRRDIDETGQPQAFLDAQVTFDVRTSGSRRPVAEPDVPPPVPEPIDEPTGGR